MLLLFTVMKKTGMANDSRRVRSFSLDKLNVRCLVTQTEKSGRQRGRNGCAQWAVRAEDIPWESILIDCL